MKSIKIAAAAAFVMGLAAAGSASADSGTIRFIGSLVDGTCQVEGGDGTIGEPGNIQVNLGDHPVASLTDTARGTPARPFSLIFSDGNGGACDASLSTAHFEIDATQTVNALTGDLRNLMAAANGGATNAEVRMLDEAGTRIDLRNRPVIDVTLDPAAPTILNLQAQIYKAVPGTAVTAGGVTSYINYNATYE